jgi:alpha-amylase
VTLVLVLHSHQPVGNLDWSVQSATDKAYRPLLQMLTEYPELTCCLHYSGSLLEWFAERAPEMIAGIRKVVARGQVELIGGAFYDPILTMLPQPDIHGQITAFRDYLAETFGQTPRGAWVAERVWEQSLTRSLADAGVEYITLDDSQFLHAGLTDRELVGGFLTEDDGRLLRVYPASEELRYRIPFQEPQKTIEYLARVAERGAHEVGGQHLVVYADDGEKFGSWPETYTHVYTNGWLRRFIETLLANRDWIHLATLAEVTDRVPPVGKIYLPDGSYREMTEWALPASRQAEYEDLVDRLKREGRYEELKPFLKMGFWRNFKAKYREANLLYAKSLAVSCKVNQLLSGAPGQRGARGSLLQQARQELYRGQCNCPYWHGVFGGLYLPHLRSAAYSKLIAAEAIADRLLGDSSAELAEVDFDLDGHAELLLANRLLWLGIAPQRGGHLFELDLRAVGAGRDGVGIFFNLTNSLTRRWEAYHRKVAPGTESARAADGVKTIHEIVAVKEPGLEKKLRYDRYERESLVDHCLPLGVTLEEVEAGQGDLADLVSSPYQVVERRSGREGVRVRLARETALRTARGGPLLVEKEIALPREVVDPKGTGSEELWRGSRRRTPAGRKKPNLPRREGEVRTDYHLRNLSDTVAAFTFAVEWNFSLLAGNAPDRYYFHQKSPDDKEARLGPLVSRHSLSACEHVGLRDEWTGIELLVTAAGAAGWFLFPCESVSQSESGLELVYQSSAVCPYWAVELPPGASTRFQVGLDVRTLTAG